MKIGLCQFHREWEAKKVNFKRAEKFIKDAKKGGCEFVFFPEMSFTGFSMNVAETKDDNVETIDYIKDIARKLEIGIGFGWTGYGKDKAQNHYSVVDKNGVLLSDYVKIHPFSFSREDSYFESGEEISVFSIDEFRVSTFICYDLRFPEIFQIASMNADMIIVAANWPASRREHWRTLLKARAIENQIYILAVNCVGTENGLTYSGDSQVINPNGEILEELSYKEGLVMIELTNNVDKFRSDFPVKNDRKEELYIKLSKIVKETVKNLTM